MKMNVKKGLAVAVILLFFSVSVIPSTASNVELEKSYVNLLYTPHDPIYINGNDDFTSENGVSGGSGTSNNPFIIEDWDIEASSTNGITIRNVSAFFAIRNCYIHDGGINTDGIVFINVINGVIENTNISGNRNGVIFRTQHPGKENSENNSIQYNTIFSNTNDGIHFEHTVRGYHSNNIIFNNNLSGNKRGIYMIMSADNQIIYNNIISNAEVGIHLDMCMGGGQNNVIHHNNFIYNGENQSHEWGGPLNYWDDGYPSGGNFWSDYTGVDNFSGPNQDIPGSDGIGDTPYEIPCSYCYENNEDKYPLMESWGKKRPPIAEFTWTPPFPDPGEIILFNASDSYDPDGYITLYEWDWDNDGEFDENHTSPTVIHSWSIEGYYPVTLKVTDNSSLSMMKRKTVGIGNQPPIVEIMNPKEGYFHFSGISLFPTALNLLADTVSVGGFRLKPIQVNALDNDEMGGLLVILFINNETKGYGTWNPETGYYEWQWTGWALGIYRLRVRAKDIYGLVSNVASIDVWNFCFIP